MIKRGLIAAVACVMCLTSCGGGVEIKKEVKEYDTDFSSVRAETAVIEGLKDKEFEDGINSEIEKDIQGAVIAFDAAAAQSADNVRMGNKCVFENTWEVKYNKNDFLSLIEERYVYMGGAHGETAWIALNIDTAGSKKVLLADLFAEAGYENTLNRMINEQVEEHPDEYSELWEKPVIKDTSQTDFYIDGDKLVLYYQPYDLSYYARGFVEFKLPLKELSGYLKEEYRRLI
ncbi:MAG: DUF3298 and DUF4163 domain-containing protein [Clostridia bacterium]|nr:DUF3298 and DUF4163 domain-containing protein [Clostridia bacterium]